MKAMKQIVVAVSLVVISAMAPVVRAQQGVEKASPGTLVAPAEALNSLLNMTESQMISLVKAFPADKYGFAPSAAIFAPGQQTEYAGVRTFGALVIERAITDRNPRTIYRTDFELRVFSTALRHAPRLLQFLFKPRS
jgi:hypothetical protein